MRCEECNVDLNENADFCPLCGGKAKDLPALIEGIGFQDYPDYRQKFFKGASTCPSSSACAP